MKCKYCGTNFSMRVWAIHEKNCPKKNDKNEPQKKAVNYNELTVSELKKLLEEKKIEIPNKAKKNDLVTLLELEKLLEEKGIEIPDKAQKDDLVALLKNDAEDAAEDDEAVNKDD